MAKWYKWEFLESQSLNVLRSLSGIFWDHYPGNFWDNIVNFDEKLFWYFVLPLFFGFTIIFYIPRNFWDNTGNIWDNPGNFWDNSGNIWENPGNFLTIMPGIFWNLLSQEFLGSSSWDFLGSSQVLMINIKIILDKIPGNFSTIPGNFWSNPRNFWDHHSRIFRNGPKLWRFT